MNYDYCKYFECLKNFYKHKEEKRREKINTALENGARKRVPKENNCKNCPYYEIETLETINPWNDEHSGHYRYIHNCKLYQTCLNVEEDYMTNSQIKKCFECSLDTKKENGEITDTEIKVFAIISDLARYGYFDKYKQTDNENLEQKTEKEIKEERE